MNKKLITGLLAAGLIAAGGTGFYLTTASAKEDAAAMKQMSGMMHTSQQKVFACDANAGGVKGMTDGKKMEAAGMQKKMGDGKMNADEMEKMMGDGKMSTDEMQKMMGDGKMGADEMKKMMGDDKLSAEEMKKMMQNGKLDFATMKPYMKKMHPKLSDKQLVDLFKSMLENGCPGNVKTENTKMNSL